MALDVVVVGSAVRDEYYTLSNLPEPDGGAFIHGYDPDGPAVAAPSA
jgi:ribokinase/sulfofructose kinase